MTDRPGIIGTVRLDDAADRDARTQQHDAVDAALGRSILELTRNRAPNGLRRLGVLVAVAELRHAAIDNGTAELSDDEINAEIDRIRGEARGR